MTNRYVEGVVYTLKSPIKQDIDGKANCMISSIFIKPLKRKANSLFLTSGGDREAFELTLFCQKYTTLECSLTGAKLNQQGLDDLIFNDVDKIIELYTTEIINEGKTQLEVAKENVRKNKELADAMGIDFSEYMKSQGVNFAFAGEDVAPEKK